MSGEIQTAQTSSIVPSYVEKGQVIDVDIENYQVHVVTEMTRKTLPALSFATPYMHFANGEGIYFMPEVGSICWVLFPSDGNKPFVVGWCPAADDKDSFRANRQSLNPGDIYLGTRDENSIILRRGGVVQIGSGPINQRIFLPVNNMIKDFCENYGLHTLGGDLEWTVDRTEKSPDGKRPGLLSVKAREFANDAEPIAVLQIGSHPDQAQNILSLVIRASGAKGAAKKITLDFRKDGSAVWMFESNVNWLVKENLAIRADMNMTLSAGIAMDVNGATVKVESKVGPTLVKSATGVMVAAAGAINLNGQATIVSDGATPALLADPAFLTWLLSHTHPSTPPGGQTGPAAAGVPLTTTGHISQKLFGK